MCKEIKCKECGKDLTVRQKMFCSNACKLSNKELTATRTSKKEKLDPTLMVKCNLTGKTFNDYKNYSGILTRHLKSLDIDLKDILEHFDIVENPKGLKQRYNCKYCDWSTTDINNKSGCITVHLKDLHDVSPSEHIENYPEDSVIWSYNNSPELREFFLSQDDSSFITCKECDMKLVRITVTHLAKHGMTMDDYRQKHGVDVLSSEKYIAYVMQHKIDSFHPKHASFVSKAQIEIKDYIESLGISTISSEKKLIFPNELDIYIPDLNIAIEYNGLYWHSESSGKKMKDYHLTKTTRCEEKGIRLIHIFEDEWVNKQDIVKSKLRSLLKKQEEKIYARKCLVGDITYIEKSMFLSKYHIQGDDISNHYYGLKHNSELLAVMTFVKPRVALGFKKTEGVAYELSRFASRINVVGGASKLLKHAIDNLNPNKIISYADRRWSSRLNDTVYDKLGFEYVSESKPNYWYTKDYHKRIHRFSFTKHKIVNTLGGDPTKTEVQNMFDMGYDRIWDCGTIKYNMDIDI